MSFVEALLEPQSRFGVNSLKFREVCPQNGTGVLKGLRGFRPYLAPKSSLATRWPDVTESGVGIAQQRRHGINWHARDGQYSLRVNGMWFDLFLSSLWWD